MAIQREGLHTWLSVYPIDEETKGWNPKDPVFVDVGGGIGHQCLALRTKYPQLPRRVIVQDLPQAIEHALPHQDVKVLAHDFSSLSQLKVCLAASKDQESLANVQAGSKFHYLRNILHDWPDDKCRAILKNLVDAMSKDSLILIHNMVLSDSNVHWLATQLDLTMLIAHASMERTKAHWHNLLDSAGLKVVKVIPYTILRQVSIIAAVPK